MKLIKADYIFLGSLFLLITAHVTTNFLIKYYEDAAVAVGIAEEVALQYEVNPIARWFFTFEDFAFLFSFAIAPGMLTGLYYLIRLKYYREPAALEAYAISFFVIMFMTASNDLSILFGVLA